MGTFMSRHLALLASLLLSGCATVPDYCGAVKATLTVEQRLDCLEARLENVNTKANVALGVGVVGLAAGLVGAIAAKDAVHMLHTAQETP
jgi:hypothetical protein